MAKKPTYEELEKRIRELEQTESGRKQVEVEEALHERQQLLEIVINELPFWFSLKDEKGRYLLVNQKMAEAHGVTISDFINRTTLHTPELHPGGLVKMLERDNQVLKTGERIEVPEYTITTAEGLRWRRLVKIPWKRNTGEVIGVISWSEDITNRKRAEEELVKYHDHLEELVDQRTSELQQEISERKRVEEALRKSEARLAESNQLLAGVLEHTHMMAVFLDPRFNFIWVNRAYADTCRHEPSFFQSKNHFEIYPHEENQAIFQSVVDTGEPHFVTAKPFEFPDQPERGVTYWDWSLIPVKDGTGKVTGLVFTLVEVTERKRTENELQKSEAELFAIYDHSPLIMLLVDEDRRVLKANRLALESTGRQHTEIEGLRGGEALGCIHAFDDPDGCGFGVDCKKCVVRNTVLDSIKNGSTHRNVEAPVQLDLGNGVIDLLFLVSTSPLNIAGTKRVLVCLENITDRKQAVASLQESQATFLTVLDGIDATIYVADMETYEILFMNKHMKDSFGADFTGKLCWKAFRDESGPCGHCTNNKLLDEKGNPARVQVWNDQNPIT